MVKRFVDSEKDIIVPRIDLGAISHYDQNPRQDHCKTPSQTQLEMMDEIKCVAAEFELQARDMFYPPDYVAQTKDFPESNEVTIELCGTLGVHWRCSAPCQVHHIQSWCVRK
ncbi:hypothetical protein JCM33374_g5594 [Metschnikowia sp. JCM 33374]|nr:hypothetical protein JCM33374_g5594 [Metschnikowia sp. JCM 33374]